MATAIDDDYTAASGATVYGGRTAAQPAWLVGSAVNKWTQIATAAMVNTPPTVNPNSRPISSRTVPWCGFAIDTRNSTAWHLANGGHDDWHGNDVLKLNLSADAPVWTEVLAASPASQIQTPSSDAPYYLDGRPASSHTYYNQQFIEARNRAIRFGAGAVATIGNGKQTVDGFDCTVAVGSNGWDAPGTYPNVALSASADASSCKDAAENVFAFNANASVRKWTQTTNTWSTVSVGSPPISAVESAVAYDTTRNRIFLLGGSESTVCHTFEPTPGTGLFTSRTLTGSAAATVLAAAKGMGLVYVLALDAFLVRRKASGGAVYSINASTFETTALPTTGGSAIPVGDTAGGGENIYTKFLVVPLLQGVFYAPSHDTPPWFLKTH